MSKPKILIQLDSDQHPSVFDAVVATDAGVDRLLQYGGVEPPDVRDLVHGAIFTRGPQELASTAIFIGGSNVKAGEELLAQATKAFFGPMRVSVLLDANGANTTAAAAVLAAARHVELRGAAAAVLAGTGSVGQRVARLLARQGASVRIASRSLERAQEVAGLISQQVSGAQLTPLKAASPAETAAALEGVQIVIAAGAAGVELASAQTLSSSKSLRVAIDLNAVPPAGLGGIEAMDKAKDRGGLISYGAIGVGGAKMKIHRAAIQQLFTANNLILDAEEIFQIGQDVQ
jgi:methylenetetrahydrofolate/methylenetetrahydromethanopterin dehydrogenase (NADP+)